MCVFVNTWRQEGEGERRPCLAREAVMWHIPHASSAVCLLAEISQDYSTVVPYELSRGCSYNSLVYSSRSGKRSRLAVPVISDQSSHDTRCCQAVLFNSVYRALVGHPSLRKPLSSHLYVPGPTYSSVARFTRRSVSPTTIFDSNLSASSNSADMLTQQQQ